MIRGFYNGISGIKTHSFGMDVWATNISNINNVGFTASIPEFKNTFYQSVANAGNNPTTDQVGLGSMGATTALSFYKQGSMMPTDNKLDMAIQGEGFFGVLDSNGETYYTRAGSFGVDKDGYLVDNEGRYVMGTQNTLSKATPSKNALQIFGKTNSVTPYLDAYTLSELGDLDLGDVSSQGKIKLPDFLYLPAKATTNVSYKGNLNSESIREQVEVAIDENSYTSNVDEANKRIKLSGQITPNETIFEPKEGNMVRVNLTDANGVKTTLISAIDKDGNWKIDELLPSTFDLTKPLNISATLTTTQEKANQEKFVTELYAKNGDKNLLTIDFTKRLPATGNSTIWDAVATVTAPDKSVISISKGTLAFGENGTLVENTLGDIKNGEIPLKIDFGSQTPAGYSGLTSTPNPKTLSVTKDGAMEGIIKEYHTNSSGNILASFSNGGVLSVAKLALYHFQNDQGLTKLGDNIYAKSANSGDAIFYKDAEGKTTYGSKIASNMLEMSNVNLAQALTEIIAIQKAYDANAKSIATSDDLIKTAINLKR
ncbi:flagellar hook-basal body complex protein [Campylobacter sp. RM16190]|uniref:flagellar hook protein FlgE n=1 Tax=Campylobacter sp. RM16190 TaxID=1705727 RepID=UPI0014745FEA|nr:flagellar hook-basal body complex protein [Campylobacter sp. RM16190]